MSTRCTSRALTISLAGLCLLASSSAWAQDEPILRLSIGPAGEERLRGTFGGDVPASDLAVGCSGFVTQLPDFVLEVETDLWVHLRVTTSSEADTTLMIRGVEGAICNDDAHEGTDNPEILTLLRAGDYAVHVGSNLEGETGPYRMRVAEAIDDEYPRLTANRSMSLQGISGGAVNATTHHPDCIGAVGARPNHVLRVSQSMRVSLTARSSSDLILVVLAPDGRVYCSDDGRGTLDPEVVGVFPQGLLRVYVGSHNPDVAAYYTLYVEPQGSS